ncbi:uncharacterized protein [Centruroides vittatus]|uniref:uncharacterized protein n=1 Tax=Centruroides vittatus TaxID=120091 RepID=UPI00350FA22C
MTSPHLKESINWPDGIRRWTINVEDLEDLNEVIMPYRISNKRLSLDFDTSPLRLLGKQSALSPRVSSAVLKYSNDNPLNLRLQKAKMYRSKKVHPSDAQISKNSLYGLQCVWTNEGQQDDLPMHVLCNITEKQDSIIAEYEDVTDKSKPKIYLQARRCSEGELSNCMRRLKLNGCPIIVCDDTDDDTFAVDTAQDQSSATCLSVPPIDIENEKKRPPLPNEQVNIVVC